MTEQAPSLADQFETEQSAFIRAQTYPGKIAKFRDLLARYYDRGIDADKRSGIAIEIENALNQAHHAWEFDGAFQQLVNVYAGRPVYGANAVGEWTGISSSFLVVPELKNFWDAIALIEAANLEHDDPAMRFLTDAYAECGEFDKLDALLLDTPEIINCMNLRVCFKRAEALHTGNTDKDLNRAIIALNYLAPLFGPQREDRQADGDFIGLRNNAVYLTRSIASWHGVLGPAFDSLAIHAQRRGSTPQQHFHGVVQKLIEEAASSPKDAIKAPEFSVYSDPRM